MTLMSGLGILLSLVFGCLLLALVAELYYVLWWKKQRICRNSNKNNEFLYLYCCDKLFSIITHKNSNTIVANPESNNNEGDVELGLGSTSSKDLLFKALGEDGVESEMMRLYNLSGPPRYLFTINEETKEDLESDDGKSRVDLIIAPETQSPFFCTPMASPPLKVSINPLFESSVEAELNRLRSSPPPTFKFLRNAEEKLYRRLLEEAQKSRILQEAVMENSAPNTSQEERESKNGEKKKEMEVFCSSLQVFPLAASPSSNPLSLSSLENKPTLHH